MTHPRSARSFAVGVLAAACLGFAPPALLSAHAAGPGGNAAKVDKARVVVTFKAGAGAAARAAARGAGGSVVVDLDEVNAFAAELPASAVAALRRNPNVELVEDDPLRHALRVPGSQPRQPLVLPGTAQAVPYGITMVQANQVSDALASGRKVCIIDSGFDRSHEDLQGLTLDGANLSGSGQWYTDEGSHGTHVAGIVAAVDNAFGVVGVLPHRQISLFIVKVFGATGSAPSSIISRAMLDCMTAKSNVVNMSLGGAGTTIMEFRVTQVLARRNILLVAAAGNEGTSAVSYPAAFPDVVSVASIDSTKTVASTSQFNADVELAAPGVGVLSTVPIGSQTGASVRVDATDYTAEAMGDSPFATASGALADFGLGDTPVAGSMSGKVCLILRGVISFADKVTNCQNSGGVAAVVYNNTTGDVNGGLFGRVTTIPSVGVQQTVGTTLLGLLGHPTTVSVFHTQDAYAFYSGTSMATPHVSGVAALVWSYYPHCTASQIRASLDLSAEDLGAAGRDPHYGFGLVQAKAAYDRISTKGCGL